MKRKPNITILIRVEGDDEEVFLSLLKNIYYTRFCGFVITIKNSFGKGPNNAIHAIQKDRMYDRYFCIIDKDLINELDEKSKNIIKQFKIEVIWNDKCLDSLLLSILNNGQDYSSYSSEYCKKLFQKKYLEGSKSLSQYCDCTKLFNKTLLEQVRTKISNLDKIIRIIENGKC